MRTRVAPEFGLVIIPGLIFLATYVVLALGRPPLVRVDRTGAAIIGAVLMVAAGGLSLDQAYRAIDYRTIVLLFGMMVLVAHLRLSWFFATAARAVVGSVRHPAALLVAVVAASGVLSAMFVNDTICLVFTPVLIDMAAVRRHNPVPYLLALATASNIGSVATITGNPQNMLIGSVSGISYRAFAGALTPVAIVGLAIDAAVIWWVFRRDLHAGPFTQEAQRPRRVHRAMMIKALCVAALVMGGFLAGLDTAMVAAGGAAVLLVTRRVKPDKVYSRIDWGLLVLFVGLFVVVGGVAAAGIDREFFALLRPVGIESVWGLSVVAALLSNLTSNVPAVMLFTRLIPQLPDPKTSWITLAMASTLAGNLTVLGSIANLIVVEGARGRGVTISFVEYLKVGVPVTLLTIGFGIWWLS